MVNSDESKRWLRDAEACLTAAERDFASEDYRATVQNSQLCIELCAKTIIACFIEPKWTHDPSDQLDRFVEESSAEILDQYGHDIITRLQQLASDAREAWPWHGRSTYGRREANGSWTAAVDVCTQETATRLLQMARSAFQTAEKFLAPWNG